MKEQEYIIIGAGAAGMMCGYLLGKQGKDVRIIEKNKTPGKKLLATGNGRCNFTNRHMEPACYYGDENFVATILKQFDDKKAIDLFEEIGIYHRERDGYCYPYSGQAVSVVELLLAACNEVGVQISCDMRVARVVHKETHYEVYCKGGESYLCRNLILATGGKANESLGGDGSGYKLSRSLRHHVTELNPALTGLVADGKEWDHLAGVRMQGAIELFVGGEFVKKEQGEIQIVKQGLSGIPVFQLCRLAAKALREGQSVTCAIDFFPQLTCEKVTHWLDAHGTECLSGLVNQKWVTYLKKKQWENEELAKLLKHYPVRIMDTFGMEKAQVTAGGVVTREVNPNNMESCLQENLYILGELLDVDGICGGYNLHFAWATAWVCSQALGNGRDGEEGENHVTI